MEDDAKQAINTLNKKPFLNTSKLMEVKWAEPEAKKKEEKEEKKETPEIKSKIEVNQKKKEKQEREPVKEWRLIVRNLSFEVILL